MSLSVKIVDNKNGEVLVDRKDVVCVIGAFGDSEKTGVYDFTRCTGVDLAKTVVHLKDHLEKTLDENPALKQCVELLSLMRQLKEKLDDFTSEGD